jgi:hypothetical protein
VCIVESDPYGKVRAAYHYSGICAYMSVIAYLLANLETRNS